ncbi:MAG: protein kinase [Clostridia bacterium]|nr:protein kinase [Clostridia bacterium]
MARIRTNKNICLYCFGDLDANRVCMNCHHKSDDTPSPPHHLPQRTVLGTQNRYLVGKALGEGGFGITYLAWDLQQGIKVAVKEYFPSGYVNRVPGSNQVIINSKQNQAASNRGLKRFVEEARALAKIKNLAGVVNVRDFFSANGTAYIVMEFLDGVSLKKYLQRKGGKLGVDEILTIMRPVMESLTQVHKIGLIHRDISPDNILITKFNEIKLIDFGAAKYSNPDGKSLSIVLKQGFAPPEQYDTHGEQGPWTDVYALGVTIYFAITGTLPPESIRVMMGKESIRRPSELGIAIEPGVENALMKCLAVDKKKRYQDVQSMMNGLYNPRAPRKAVTALSPAPAPVTAKKTVISRTAALPPTTPAQKKQPIQQPQKQQEKPATATRPITQTRPITSTRPETKPSVKPAAAASKPATNRAAATAKPAAASKAATPATPKPAAEKKPIAPVERKPATAKPATATAPADGKITETKTKSGGIFSKLFKKK